MFSDPVVLNLIFVDPSFAIIASKATIDGTKLAGGALAAIEVNLYSTNTTYYVYRSLKSFTGTVYFKAIV